MRAPALLAAGRSRPNGRKGPPWLALALLVPALLALLLLLAYILVPAREQQLLLSKEPSPPPQRQGAPPPPQQHGKVYLGYGVSGGLCNQLNAHINALALALALAADAVVLPPAWSRRDYLRHNSSDNSGWDYQLPVGSLLDVDGMRPAWLRRGIELLEASGWSGLAA